ncbi:MAG: tetratricopeptide repeat protein, partial [bacterium]
RGRRARTRLGVLVAIGAVLILGGGCRTKGATHPHDPRVRLEALLEDWRRVREDGATCEQRRPGETPLIDCERTRKRIERLAIEFPRDPQVLLAHAVVGFESGRIAEAAQDLDALRRFMPAQPDAALLRSRIAITEGNLRFARRLLDEQIELTPDHAGLRELSASVHYLDGHHDAALRDLERARRLGAPLWRTRYHEGLIAEARGASSRAARAYRASLDENPGFGPARARLRALDAMAEEEPPERP